MQNIYNQNIYRNPTELIWCGITQNCKAGICDISVEVCQRLWHRYMQALEQQAAMFLRDKTMKQHSALHIVLEQVAGIQFGIFCILMQNNKVYDCGQQDDQCGFITTASVLWGSCWNRQFRSVKHNRQFYRKEHEFPFYYGSWSEIHFWADRNYLNSDTHTAKQRADSKCFFAFFFSQGGLCRTTASSLHPARNPTPGSWLYEIHLGLKPIYTVHRKRCRAAAWCNTKVLRMVCLTTVLSFEMKTCTVGWELPLAFSRKHMEQICRLARPHSATSHSPTHTHAHTRTGPGCKAFTSPHPLHLILTLLYLQLSSCHFPSCRPVFPPSKIPLRQHRGVAAQVGQKRKLINDMKKVCVEVKRSSETRGFLQNLQQHPVVTWHEKLS